MVSPLQTFRRERGLSQEQLAKALGLSSKGYVSRLESGDAPINLKLALKIERWSGGELKAADLCPEAAELLAGAEAGAEARP